MEQLTLTTPALLFSAISLIFLAFTNRFLAYAQIIRNLHASYKEEPKAALQQQINNLKKRLKMIQLMQILGISSLLLCVMCMGLLYLNFYILAEILFAIALILLVLSLAISILEIQISVKALDFHLNDME